MRIPILGPGPGSGLGNKWQTIAQVIKNGDTVTLPAGTPVVLQANGTEDGVAVVLPSTAGLTQVNLMIGIIGQSCAVNAFQDAICYGLITNARILLQTRSASTAAFASWPAIAVGDVLTVESVNNGLIRSGAGASTIQQQVFVAMASFASGTTQASTFTLANATTVASGLIVSGKVFVRAM